MSFFIAKLPIVCIDYRYMNKELQIKRLEVRIEKLKRELNALGAMRPGSISKQYNVCGNPNCKCKDEQDPQKHGPYYQLSYVHKGKNSSQFIREECLAQTQKQVENYKKFKKLTGDWVTLALEQAKLLLEQKREQG